MDMNTLPPDSKSVPEWLEWLADAPCLSSALDVAGSAGVVEEIVVWAVARWERETFQGRSFQERVNRLLVRHGIEPVR